MLDIDIIETHVEEVVRRNPSSFIVDGQELVPKDVCDMMLGYWEVDPSESVAVLFSPTLAINARAIGYTDITYVGKDLNATLRNTFDILGIKCITLKEFKNGMKFDFGLVNPPYSEGQGNKLLYPAFFNMCLDKCTDFVMVMPVDLGTRQPKLKKHNYLVKKHCSYIGENVSEYFKVGMRNIHYVVASKSVENEVVSISDSDPYEDVSLLFPKRQRITSLKGVGGSKMFGKYPTSNSVTVIQKVHKEGEVITYKEKVKNISNWKAKSSSPWVLLLNHTPSKGKFNYSVVKNDGSVAFGNWVHVIEVRTKREGITQGEFLQTKEVCEKVMELLKANNGTHTASQKLVNLLPWFE